MARTQIIAEPGVPQILITREFDAARLLLFRAHIDPDLLVQWLGPRWLTTTIDRFDPRHGGTWHYTQWDPEGSQYAFGGVFHGEPSLDGIVQTLEFEGRSGHVCLRTVTFTEHGSKTMLSHNTVFQTAGDRDRKLESGMGEEADDSMERLGELLAGLTSVR